MVDDALITRPDTLPGDPGVPRVNGHAANLFAVLSAGIQAGQSVETIKALTELYKDAMRQQQEADFIAAKVAFQAECPKINRNRSVKVDRGPSYNFADIEAIQDTIRPVMEKHGLSYDFEQSYTGDLITVTCHLRHIAGHRESTKFSAPWATNAGMSAAQKYASATTFCQRYALRLALGLPIGDDTDVPPEPPPNPTRDNDAPKVQPRAERGDRASKLHTWLGKQQAKWSAATGQYDIDAWYTFVRTTAGLTGSPQEVESWASDDASRNAQCANVEFRIKELATTRREPGDDEIPY